MTAPPPSRFPLNPDFIWLHTANNSKIPVSCLSKRGMTTLNASSPENESSFGDRSAFEMNKYYIIFSHANAEDIYLISRWV